MRKYFILFSCAVFFFSCDNEKKVEENTIQETTVTESVPAINYSVKAYHPHDMSLFTEGLLFHNGQLFESTGSPENLPQTLSLIGISDLKTGKFTKKVQIDKSKYFGEGIVFLNNKLYQLTYKNQMGFVYDASSFKQTGTFKYSNIEGWGLTTDGSALIMSDGTDKLTYLDPEHFNVQKTISVSNNGVPQQNLNELEWINGFIYANIWTEDIIVKIDPATGKVVGRLDLSSIVNEVQAQQPQADVLNGIAFDPANNKVFVTGKLWPTIYEIEFPH